jgi:hypothetical protein
MKASDAKKTLTNQYKRQNTFIKDNYDRVSITLPKGTKEKIKASGYSINGLINELVFDFLNQQENKAE